MRQVPAKKPKRKQGGARGHLSLEKDIHKLATAVVEVGEEIELVSEEGSPLEDIEGAKALAADVLEKYAAMIKRLGPEDRRELEQSVGHGVERIKKGLMQLKEAPE